MTVPKKMSTEEKLMKVSYVAIHVWYLNNCSFSSIQIPQKENSKETCLQRVTSIPINDIFDFVAKFDKFLRNHANVEI